MKRLPLILFMIFLSLAASGRVKQYAVKAVAEYPHSTDSYTQGLFFNDGKLYESTGQYGESTFRIVDLRTGEALRKLSYSGKYFVEGSVILGDRLYVLTWTSRVAFVYDAASLKYLKTYGYPREGWGLTTDGRSLIASDGSDKLYFMDKDFKVQKTLSVRMNGKGVRMLNELEWIDGRIWANVYTTDSIVIINPSSGEVEAQVDCRGLLPQSQRGNNPDVLNGIAYNPLTEKIYLTGKLWSRLYEIRLIEK